MIGIAAAAVLGLALEAANGPAATKCFPVPHADEVVALVEPRNAAIYDPRGVWVEFSVMPFGTDIRGTFTLAASATPLDGTSPAQRLTVDPPYRLSGDTLGGPASPMAAVWIAHIAKPDKPSHVSVTYSINLWSTPSGTPCEGPPSVRRIGDFLWVPTNGTGPFGQKPPVR